VEEKQLVLPRAKAFGGAGVSPAVFFTFGMA